MNPAKTADLAPHGIVIQSALTSAKDRIAGMNAQLVALRDVPTAQKGEAIKQYQAQAMDLKGDLAEVQTHQRMLTTSLAKYPDIQTQQPIKNLDGALQSLNELNTEWLGKAQSTTYWENTDVAKNDLAHLESSVNQALARTKTFNSTLGVSYTG
jgi:hypothetical protein